MPVKNILVDLTHNEEVEILPDLALKEEYEIEEFEDGPLNLDVLSDYDLLVLGNPQYEAGSKESFFTKEEIVDIKKYLGRGGGLLLASGAGGDRDLKRATGSIRVFFTVTGITRFWNGQLLDDQNCLVEPEHLLFNHYGKHWITRGLKEVVLSGSTFLEIAEEAPNTKIVLQTDDTANFKYMSDGTVDNVGKVPLIACSEYLQGRTVTLGSSKILLEDPDFGIEVKDNKKLVRNILAWILFENEV